MSPHRTASALLALLSVPLALACSAETATSSDSTTQGVDASSHDAATGAPGASEAPASTGHEATPETARPGEPPPEQAAAPGAEQHPLRGSPTAVIGVPAVTETLGKDRPRLPGRVEGEDYDRFVDTTAGNSGGACQDDDVDVELSSDDDGTCNLAWTEAGEWLEYDVTITTRGVYDLVARVAGFSGTIHFELDGSDITGAIPVNTDGWQTWRDVVIPNITLPLGAHTLRLTFDGSGANLNYFEFVEASAPPLDSDGDGLSDHVETNTGVFAGPNDSGTDPLQPDTDGDGLSDGDETLGTREGLDLPTLGTSPLRKNILLEYDWFDDDNECAFHSHRPTGAVIFDVTEAFANAPVDNPDGSTGITLINDYGQGGAFTGGTLIPDDDGLLVGKVSDAEFQNHKKAHFAPNRWGYFHYVILPHRFDTNSDNSGQAEFRDDDIIVSLYCFYDNRRYVAYTIMHELGHNLNLRHGGDEDVNGKPNYNSVMNYQFQFQGVDVTCDGRGDYVLDYSSGIRPSLDETALDERSGVCGRYPAEQPLDWNKNNRFDSKPIAHDINGDSFRTTLRDHDDWANLVYDWDRVHPGAGLAVPESTPQLADCQSVPPHP